MLQSGYPIARPTGVCAATGRPLTVGERYVAALVQEPGSDDMKRLDYSFEAWESGARPAAPAELVGHWRSVVPDPGEKRPAFIDDEALLDLFTQLEGQTDPKRVAFRFVLGLILIRKRLLTVHGSRREAMLVRPRGAPKPPEGPPLIELVDPGLDESSIAEISGQLDAIMGAGDPEDGPGEAEPGERTGAA